MSLKKAVFTVSAFLVVGGLSVGGLWAQGAGSTAGKPEKPPATAAAPRKEGPKELAFDEGKAAGRRSIAGSGHAVRFDAPEGSGLVQVRVHGARYGLPRAPREDFVVFVCDEAFHKIAEFPFRYGNFERGEPQWARFDVKRTRLPKTFYLGVDFDPTQTKGIFLSHDGKESNRSVVGLPDEKPTPFTKGNWMIRAVVAPEP